MLPENLFICECDASSMLNLSTTYCVKYAPTLESMDAPIVCGVNEAKIPPDIVQQVLYQQTWQSHFQSKLHQLPQGLQNKMN